MSRWSAAYSSINTVLLPISGTEQALGLREGHEERSRVQELWREAAGPVCPPVYLPASPTLMKKKGATPLKGDLSVQVHTLHIP